MAGERLWNDRDRLRYVRDAVRSHRPRTPVKRLLSGAAKLGAGVAFGQMLVVLVSPVLSRLYTPEQFGAYALVVAIAALVTVVSTGRLELAVPVARSNRDARDALLLGLLYLLVGTVFATVVVVGGTVLGQEIVLIGPELLLVPVFAFFGGLFELASAYLFRRSATRPRPGASPTAP